MSAVISTIIVNYNAGELLRSCIDSVLNCPLEIEIIVVDNARQIFDHFINALKRNGNIAWADDGMGVADVLVHTFAEAQEHWARSVSSADYIDVHCWRFTPTSFRILIPDLQSLGLANLEIKAELNTTGCEFYVSLGKKVGSPAKLDRLAALQAKKLEDV
ncbi:MAG TPA: glycosyltransferase [Methylobacter sp.]|jgi:hypothetical protein